MIMMLHPQNRQGTTELSVYKPEASFPKGSSQPLNRLVLKPLLNPFFMMFYILLRLFIQVRNGKKNTITPLNSDQAIKLVLVSVGVCTVTSSIPVSHMVKLNQEAPSPLFVRVRQSNPPSTFTSKHTSTHNLSANPLGHHLHRITNSPWWEDEGAFEPQQGEQCKSNEEWAGVRDSRGVCDWINAEVWDGVIKARLMTG